MPVIPHFKTGLVIAVSVIATGALINAASNGLFGSEVKKAADYVKNGYGV